MTFPDPIPGILPFGTVTVFAGAPGVGKTAMLVDWIRSWIAGTPINGYPTHPPPGGFYYLAADRQWASHLQWLTLVGHPDIPHYSLADDPKFKLEALLKPYNALMLLSDALDALSPRPGGHVIVDPVSPLFIAGNPNSQRDVAYSMMGISREAQRRQINITCAAHFSKQRSEEKDQYARPQDRIAGSTSFAGFTDTQMYLVDPAPPDRPYHTFGWVPRHRRSEEFTFTRGESGLFEPYDVLREDIVASQVLDCFPDAGTVTISTLIDLVLDVHRHAKSTTKRACDRLIKQGRIARAAKGVYQRVKLH